MKKIILSIAFCAGACVMPPAAATNSTTTTTTPTTTTTSQIGDDGNGPPAVRRFIPGQEARAAAPYGRGDYLVALDYRDEGGGTYGYLANGDGRWWVVEQDQVVGGPLVDGGPEMQAVTARWSAFESQRHQAVMNGVASYPHGCLDGCAFDVTDGSGRQSTQIQY